VNKYGRVIHEFDPWFNFRATEYLVEHGYEAFSEWYDTESWYPLGRPVGSTVYPGMMVTAASLFHSLQYLGLETSLNDVCVFMPAGFAALTCLLTAGLTRECGADANAAVLSAVLMAFIPAHLMRSVAGMFDNECVAMTLIAAVFFFWVRSIRCAASWPYGLLAGLSYICLACTWGGYVFAINMVGAHAGVLLLLGRFKSSIHKAYSLFFIIGTIGALQFHIVGWAPLKSMEQLGPILVFFAYQVFELLEKVRQRCKIYEATAKTFRNTLLGIVAVMAFFLIAAYVSSDQVWALSVRVRSLFIKHTKTGNPLVDSVAEHQATNGRVFAQFFHFTYYLCPIGCIMLFFRRNDSNIFLMLYAFFAWYFSRKMMRLVLLLAPPACAATGIALVGIIEWSYGIYCQETETEELPKKGGLASHGTNGPKTEAKIEEGDNELMSILDESPAAKKGVALALPLLLLLFCWDFCTHSRLMAERLSEPQIIVSGTDETGQPIIYDDFRQAYWWLRDNTPEDSRVMAWWDYGYQINGIANRTTIADGNTWNHEHIALLGKCLVSNETASHAIARHLADYVLVWSTRHAGLWGDDLAKSPHMARIAGSVYSDIDPKAFSMDRDNTPSEMMEKSLLFRLHSWNIDETYGGHNLTLYQHAYTSHHKMVRIYQVNNISKESKEWVKHNRGKYPPSLHGVLAEKNSFDQTKRV